MTTTSLSMSLTTVLIQIVLVLVASFFTNFFMAKKGIAPGQEQAMATMKTTTDALLIQVDVLEKEKTRVKADLEKEQAKNAALTSQLIDTNTALAHAATKFLLLQQGDAGALAPQARSGGPHGA